VNTRDPGPDRPEEAAVRNPTDDTRLAPGDRVELASDPPDYGRYALTAGDRGTVEFTDSLHTIHVRWAKGCQVGIIAELAGLLCRRES
jgi:hypothetical protein